MTKKRAVSADDVDDASPINDAPKVSVERTQLAQAYRFASTRDLETLKGVKREAGPGSYARYVGVASDGRRVVEFNTEEFYFEANPLDVIR